jgi:NADPH:quinone reductase-like Zn-dependent oxidoreductase
MAGTIVSVGDSVRTWKEGDRVCANFALDHLDGDVTPEMMNTPLGGAIDGVLREYIAVPTHVRLYLRPARRRLADPHLGSPSFASQRATPLRKPRLFRTSLNRGLLSSL